MGFGFTCAGDALWRKSQLDNVFALRAFNPHLADKVLLNVEEALLANRAFGLFVHATPPYSYPSYFLSGTAAGG